jgi:hypothetical protein
MVIDAAATNGWETAQRKYAQLLGCRNAKQTQLVEQWLEETREQLAGEAGADMELIRAALAGRWAGRWADVLEENKERPEQTKVLTVIEHQQATTPVSLQPAPERLCCGGGALLGAAVGPGRGFVTAARPASRLSWS